MAEGCQEQLLAFGFGLLVVQAPRSAVTSDFPSDALVADGAACRNSLDDPTSKHSQRLTYAFAIRVQLAPARFLNEWYPSPIAGYPHPNPEP